MKEIEGKNLENELREQVTDQSGKEPDSENYFISEQNSEPTSAVTFTSVNDILTEKKEVVNNPDKKFLDSKNIVDPKAETEKSIGYSENNEELLSGKVQQIFNENQKSDETLKKENLTEKDIMSRTSNSKSKLFQYFDENEIKTKLSEDATTYRESVYSVRHPCDSVRTRVSLKSWPSSASLSKDSDVYPCQTEYSVVSSLSGIEREFSNDNIKEISTVNSDDTVRDEQILLDTLISEIPEENNSQQSHTTVEPTQQPIFKESTESFSQKPIPSLSPLFEVLPLPLTANCLKKICFSETFLISYEWKEPKDARSKPLEVCHKSQMTDTDQIQEMGGMCLSIESNNNNIITFCTTQFSCLGSAGASRLISVVDDNFNLVEEKKTEWHCTHSANIEKILHVVREGEGYVAFRTEKEDNDSQQFRCNMNLDAKGSFILDGGVLALMRYLIITKFSGEINTWSMHITGDVCRCKFTVGKKKVLYINNSPYMTIQIKKELLRSGRYPDVSKTYFLPSGHMIRHKWRGCKYFIHVNPIGAIPPPRSHYKLREYQWEKDVMLVSKYLDEKATRRSQIQTYLEDNGEIKSILGDYMLCLLQLKPQNVLDFTIEYFLNLFSD